MKRFIAPFLVLFFTVGAVALCQTKTLTFQWDDTNPADVQVTEYVFYQSDSGADPAVDTFTEIARIPVGTLQTAQALTVDTGKHWYYVTATNDMGESGPSNVVMVNTNRPLELNLQVKRN